MATESNSSCDKFEESGAVESVESHASILTPKKNTSSIVWGKFGLKNESDKNTATCKKCQREVKTPGGNTSNLWHHLRDNHPYDYAELNKIKSKSKLSQTSTTTSSSTNMQINSSQSGQPGILGAFSRLKKIDINSNQAKQYHFGIGRWIAKDMIPFSAVEKLGFRQMIQTFNPKYQVPSRTYFKDKIIPQIHLDVSKSVTDELASAEKFSFTTDMWTSVTMDPYMSLTIHFINKIWDLKSINLGTIPFSEDHTGVNMAEGIKAVLNDWNLKLDDVVCGTTDNASNNSTMFKALDKLQLSCFGHNLDLAVNEGLKLESVNRSVRLVRVAVDTFSRSWKKTKCLKEAQDTLGLPQHKLIHDVPTRWGSTANMIHRFLEQQQAVNAVLYKERKYWHVMPDVSTINVLEKTDSVLFPLSKLTDTFSGDQYVTVSSLVPVLGYIKQDLLKVNDGDTGLAENLKNVIRKSIEKRYDGKENTELLISVCCYLDPRFRNSFLSDDMVQKVKEHLLYLYDIENDNDSNNQEAPIDEHETEEETKKSTSGSNIAFSGSLTNLLKMIEGRKKVRKLTLSERDKFQKEIVLYTEVEELPTAEQNPLLWWKIHESTFPKLAVFARRFLSVPATSCSSERLFSGAGLIATKCRNRLHPETVNQMIFLNRNLQLSVN